MTFRVRLGFYFFRWLSGCGELLNGMIMVLTGGFWCPDISLRCENMFMNYCERNDVKS